jgi:hypothetical protein
VAPWWSWYHKLPIKNKKKKIIILKDREVKGHTGTPWWQKGIAPF